jgi:hypothetical protein
MSTDLFHGLSYESLMAELGWRMSRISKEATLDSWHYTVDEEMPKVCYEIAISGMPGYFDTEAISVVEARLLVAMGERLGHWVVPGEGLGWKPYVPESMKHLGAGQRAEIEQALKEADAGDFASDEEVRATFEKFR